MNNELVDKVVSQQARITALERDNAALRAKAALADELYAQEAHTVFWWADYLERWRTRYAALSAPPEAAP